jgi:acyl-CoA synthetase (AMP-forming)/AMP-acid ligase II
MYTLGDIIRKSAIAFSDFEATVFEDTRLTYRELNDRTNLLANALTTLGYKKGDRITVLAENTHKYLEVYFATAKLGMSLTPLNFRLSDAELVHIINDSEAIGFLAGDAYEERALGLKPELTNIQNWIALDNPFEGYQEYEELISQSSTNEPGVEVDETEMAVLMYTGGTTGLPKGVMMSHRNVMTALISAIISAGFNRFDCTCFILPLFHVAFWQAMCVLMVGGKVAINRRPDLNGILKLIQDEKCTHINAVPTIYQWILQLTNPDDFDLSSLRSMTYAGSPFPPEVLKQCIQKFGPIFSQGYGMTEALGATGLGEWDHHMEGDRSRLLASAGKPSVCADVRIADDNGNTLPPNQIGEILIKGKHVMMGYWKNPELTKDVLRGGWYHTGDMGYMDDEGYLFMVDRKADMIVTGGENVYPKETEEALYQHPAVMECGVVSAPDEKWGERVQAVVVLKPGMETTPEALMAHCKANLAGYKCPKNIEIWAGLPKTPIGKIIRKDIKKKFWEGHERTIG